jgi:hypothetical protein
VIYGTLSIQVTFANNHGTMVVGKGRLGHEVEHLEISENLKSLTYASYSLLFVRRGVHRLTPVWNKSWTRVDPCS